MKTSVKAKHENNGGTNGQSELNSRCYKKSKKEKDFCFGFFTIRAKFLLYAATVSNQVEIPYQMPNPHGGLISILYS